MLRFKIQRRKNNAKIFFNVLQEKLHGLPCL